MGVGQQAEPRFFLLDEDYQPLRADRPFARNPGHHVQVSPTVTGWLGAWVENHPPRLIARALSADGMPQAPGIPLLDATSPSRIGHPDLAFDDSGAGLFAWSIEVVRTTWYGIATIGPAGLGPALIRNQGMGYLGGPPAVCAGENGFLVAWQSDDRQTSSIDIERFTPNGLSLAPAATIAASSTADLYSRPACEGAPQGWAVAWRATAGLLQHRGTFLHFLDPDGIATEPPVEVDPTGEGVAMASLGDLLVLAWSDEDADRGGVAMQAWSFSTRQPLTPVLRVNEEQAEDQTSVDVGIWETHGQIRGAVVWHDGQLDTSRVSGRVFGLSTP